MAKQSFSVGQVLTANQMLSLQQTAMLGGSATAKTTSHTLVAADAGTVVSVNSTSATTITVNTGLFSAGDTVTIQNWGSGLVTITAGTATVNTAGSLIVPQYDGGVLYFTSASAAIYFDFVQAGAVSPLTTKGDLYTFGSSDTRIGVGANDTVLTADSSTATGLKWATPAGGSYTLLSTTSITSASTTVSSISQSYQDLFIEIYGITFSTSNGTPTLTINASGNSHVRAFTDTYTSKAGTNLDLYGGSNDWDRTSANNYYGLQIRNYTTTDRYKSLVGAGVTTDSVPSLKAYGWTGTYTDNTAISQIAVNIGGGRTFSTGTIKVWGIK
jgi:hypothetical protein